MCAVVVWRRRGGGDRYLLVTADIGLNMPNMAAAAAAVSAMASVATMQCSGSSGRP